MGLEERSKFAEWYSDPSSFYRDIFKEEPFPYQRKILGLLKDFTKKRIIIVAAGGTGKTKLLACVALWYSCILPFFKKEPIEVIIISGSKDQAKHLYTYSRFAILDTPELSKLAESKPLISETRFKDRSVIRALPTSLQSIQGKHGCYSEDTQVLTENGWKFFPELGPREKIATLDSKGQLTYQEPTCYFSYPRKGWMIHLFNRYIDLLVTPDHRQHCKTAFKGWHLRRMGNFPKRYWLKRNASWEGRTEEFFLLPSYYEPYHKKTYPSKNLKMNDWLEFLGYYLSEGSCEFHRGTNRITLGQANGEIKEKMVDCIIRLGLKPIERPDRIRIHDRQLYEYLKNLGRYAWEKFTPKEFKILTTKQLNILLEALCLGDSSRKRKYYGTSSRRLRDDIEEIALKCGYSPTEYFEPTHWKYFPKNRKEYLVKDHWKVSLSKKKGLVHSTGHPSHKQPIEKTREWYEGKVYCVSVPNQVIYVKRNGKMCWSGNSLVLIDEAVLAGDFIMKDSLRIIDDKPWSKIIFSGTPMNEEGGDHFIEIWENPDKYPEWHREHWSAAECPLKSGLMEEARKEGDEIYDIFWLGKPHPRIGTMVPVEKIKFASQGISRFKLDPEGEAPVAGIDWGFGRSETGIVIRQKVGGQIRVLEAIKRKGVSPTEIYELVERLNKTFPLSRIYADAENKSENIRLEEKGYPVFPKPFRIQKGIWQANVRKFFMEDKILIPEDFVDLLWQVKRYSYDTKGNDDLVDALLLSCIEEETETGSYSPVYLKAGKRKL